MYVCMYVCIIRINALQSWSDSSTFRAYSPGYLKRLTERSVGK